MNRRMVLTLAACSFVLLITANRSDGVGAVYQTASPATGNSSIILQAGIGEALQLECDLYAGAVCEWDVSVWYDNFDGGAISWGLDFGLLDPAQFNRFAVSNLLIPFNQITHLIGPYQINQPNGLLIDNATGGNIMPEGVGPALWEVMTFRLTQFNVLQNLGLASIHAGVSAGEFGGNDPQGFTFYEIVTIGPNTPRIGVDYGPWQYDHLPLPVITINNVPEPAALLFLVVGVFTLIRRKDF